MLARWGTHMSSPKGYIVEIGYDEFPHRFGGQSWRIEDAQPLMVAPTLLLTLDLTDPRLSAVQMPDCNELPLCSYINISVWEGKQIYQINPDNHHVNLIQKISSSERQIYDEPFPDPLPEKPIKLRTMTSSEYPIDEENYYSAFDQFLGGSAFIRVLGPPLWINPITEYCLCGRPLEYIASIGYEVHTARFIENMPFFLGEAALYFLLCRPCMQYVVISQG